MLYYCCKNPYKRSVPVRGRNSENIYREKIMKKILRFISHVLGFDRLSKYENEYLHDANIRCSSYMGGIVVFLELWMLIRQCYSKITPKYQAGGDIFELLVNN